MSDYHGDVGLEHRADRPTGSLRIVRHRSPDGPDAGPGDAGHEVVGYALLVSVLGLGALTAAQLSAIAVEGLSSLLVALQAHLA